MTALAGLPRGWHGATVTLPDGSATVAMVRIHAGGAPAPGLPMLAPRCRLEFDWTPEIKAAVIRGAALRIHDRAFLVTAAADQEQRQEKLAVTAVPALAELPVAEPEASVTQAHGLGPVPTRTPFAKDGGARGARPPRRRKRPDVSATWSGDQAPAENAKEGDDE